MGSSAPTFREAFAVWTKIGWLSFGGPAGQIALMHRILVDEKRWIEEARFLHALNYCMLLPGPEAQQLATYVGWLLHGVRGGLAAGVLFILPGALVLLVLSCVYVLYQGVPLLEAVFVGVKAAVLVIVIEALLRIAKRVLKNQVMKIVAVCAFLGIFVGNIPFPIIVLAAALVGLIGIRAGESRFEVLTPQQSEDGPIHEAKSPPTILRTMGIAIGGILLWGGPIVVSAVLLGKEHVLVSEGIFFSKLAVVTFGGAYAVLAYMAQQAVDTYAWLTASEMLDGLGLAESTPGPLIMVTQFVGFLGAYRNAAPFEPMTAAVLGSVMTVWATFVPCFLWILLGAPYVERMRYNRYASAALSTITAAVVGVVLNLTVWFGIHVLFREVHTFGFDHFRLLAPDPASIDLAALVIAVIAGIGLLRYRVGVVWTLIVCAVSGILLSHVPAGTQGLW
jgi:chromate transporter